MSYLAIINTPGYLSEQDEIPEFDTIVEAWEYLASERDESEMFTEMFDDRIGEIDGHNEAFTCGLSVVYHELISQTGTGAVYAPTPGRDYDDAYDLGVIYSVVESEQGE